MEDGSTLLTQVSKIRPSLMRFQNCRKIRNLMFNSLVSVLTQYLKGLPKIIILFIVTHARPIFQNHLQKSQY